jgi:hypothetical protein
MTNHEIARLFDQSPNMTLAELSRITGKSVKQLKAILMSGKV